MQSFINQKINLCTLSINGKIATYLIFSVKEKVYKQADIREQLIYRSILFLTQLHMCEHMQVYIFSTEGRSPVSRRVGWNEKSHGLNASLCNMLHSVISFILYFVKPWQLCWKITETVLVVIQQTFKSCFRAHLKGRW